MLHLSIQHVFREMVCLYVKIYSDLFIKNADLRGVYDKDGLNEAHNELTDIILSCCNKFITKNNTHHKIKQNWISTGISQSINNKLYRKL